jgi:hypothetical protein
MDRCPHCNSKKGFTYKTEATIIHDVPSWDELRETVVDVITKKWPRVVTCKKCKQPVVVESPLASPLGEVHANPRGRGAGSRSSP